MARKAYFGDLLSFRILRSKSFPHHLKKNNFKAPYYGKSFFRLKKKNYEEISEKGIQFFPTSTQMSLKLIGSFREVKH